MEHRYVMHVISGTHWDREWRYTAEQSKVRLVGLLDSLLDIDLTGFDLQEQVFDLFRVNGSPRIEKVKAPAKWDQSGNSVRESAKHVCLWDHEGLQNPVRGER